MKKNLYYCKVITAGQYALARTLVLIFVLSFFSAKTQTIAEKTSGIVIHGSAQLIIAAEKPEIDTTPSQSLSSNSITVLGEARILVSKNFNQNILKKDSGEEKKIAPSLAKVDDEKLEKLIADIKTLKKESKKIPEFFVRSNTPDDSFSRANIDNYLAVVNINIANLKIKAAFIRQEFNDLLILAYSFQQNSYEEDNSKSNYLISNYLFARPPPNNLLI